MSRRTDRRSPPRASEPVLNSKHEARRVSAALSGRGGKFRGCRVEREAAQIPNMRRHTAAGMPPLLHFESETVAEASQFTPPSNYRLLRITRCGTDALEKHVRRSASACSEPTSSQQTSCERTCA